MNARPWRIRIRRSSGDNCNHLSDEPCTLCEAERLVYVAATPKLPALQFFGEHTYEHMYDPWETPRSFSSPEALRQEAERRGVESQALKDSLIWRSGANRWV
jgi:hypothetical protein